MRLAAPGPALVEQDDAVRRRIEVAAAAQGEAEGMSGEGERSLAAPPAAPHRWDSLHPPPGPPWRKTTGFPFGLPHSS